MRSRTSSWVAGVAVAALVAGGGYWLSQHPAGGSASQDFAVMVTPPGVTLQSIAGSAKQRGDAPTAQVIFADAKGMTLYTYDKDVEPNKSVCTGDCVKTWPPATAPNDAKPFGKWSAIGRDDGTKQWAYGGKPLYTFVKDKDPGSVGGNSPKVFGGASAGGLGAPKKIEEMPAGWHAASFQPASGIAFPSGVELREVPDAFGQVLVNEHGMTLYAFEGEAKNDKQTCITNAASCADRWIPFAAAEIANPVGDFSVVTRPNGIKQWAFKSQPLYTFSGDIVPGEAHGIGVDKSWHVAMLQRYFTPAGVTVRQSLSFGDSLATASGMTIYRRDSKQFQTSGHASAKNLLGIPTTGRVIGTDGCDADCLKTWHPLLAAADARPSGYWELMTRGDGTRQWAYKGYALYTYAGDKKPGDMTGHDIYDLVIDDGLHKTPYQAVSVALAPLIPNYSISLYWTYAAP